MRQAAEHVVGPLGDRFGREVFERQVEPARERRVHFADRLRFGLAGRERRDLGVRMPQQQLDQLEGRIAGRTENRHALFRTGHAF